MTSSYYLQAPVNFASNNPKKLGSSQVRLSKRFASRLDDVANTGDLAGDMEADEPGIARDENLQARFSPGCGRTGARPMLK